MRYFLKYNLLILALLLTTRCSELLEPEPIDLLTDDTVLNEPKDVPNVEIGLYSAFRNIIPNAVIAGDCTADMLLFNGTFNQYRELGTKQITSANASALSLWGSIYNTVYIANFILERLPDVPGVPASQRDQVLATAHFLRGYAYFVALYSFGGVPLVTETAIDANRNIPRASESDLLAFILDDYNAAIGKLPAQPANAGFAGTYALDAAFAKYYLYLGNWAKAEQHASSIIGSNQYSLESNFATLVDEDFTDEAIFEMGYTLADDPGTSATGLNNIFVGRREMIPSNEVVVALASIESGERFSSIRFKADLLKGNDNGWSVAKYGTADEDNNNVVVFRLGEIYLIRAEARAQQGKVTEARADIDLLRGRAKAPLLPAVNQSQMLQIIETERRYELAFEGHRWYDLVRTGRAKAVMSSFSTNWKDTYEVWPIPQREIQNNPSLVGNQNPGY
ncbi:MAG: RagB/SusD family nutrient uptake outer membrane protein [Cyclobacteriaceae bacterium]|nr:RagB/SusD family nutrient uptake outer membrane protein [Cyclobacteriaceae bacterium]